MSNRYFIDGYNLLHQDSGLKSLANRDLESARNQLIEMIGRWSVAAGETVTIVFDGRDKRAEPSEPVPGMARLDVIFTSRHRTADSLIERAVYQASNKDSIVVVSADRGITDFCLGVGAITMKPDHFLTMLQDNSGHVTARLEATRRNPDFGRIEDQLDEDARSKLEGIRKKLDS